MEKEKRPKRTVIKPQRYQTTSSDEADSGRRTFVELQSSQLKDDIAELRGVLENNSPDIDMHAHSNHSLTYTPLIDHTKHANNTPHTSDTTHLLTYTQPTVNHTTQAFCPNDTTHSLAYTQPLTTNHTTQAPFMHDKSQSLSHAQNFHHTTQTFTHEPHASVTHTQTHTQHIGNRLNTPYNTQLQTSNTWPIEIRRLPSPAPSSSRAPGTGEFYDMRPEIQAIHGRIDHLALEMQKIHQKLDKILMQQSNSRRHVPEKPAILPISSVTNVEEFETVNDEEYMKLVNYLIFIGGFNAKESIGLCVKEVFQDSLMISYTWFGREENQWPLYNTRLVKAIYDAICENKNFAKPMRAAFQTYMRDAVRTANQRHRNKGRNNSNRPEGGHQKKKKST